MSRICFVSAFHKREADTLKARSPAKRSLVLGSTSLTAESDGRVLILGTCNWSISLKYWGAIPSKALNARRMILYLILDRIVNQNAIGTAITEYPKASGSSVVAAVCLTGPPVCYTRGHLRSRFVTQGSHVRGLSLQILYDISGLFISAVYENILLTTNSWHSHQ